VTILFFLQGPKLQHVNWSSPRINTKYEKPRLLVSEDLISLPEDYTEKCYISYTQTVL